MKKIIMLGSTISFMLISILFFGMDVSAAGKYVVKGKDLSAIQSKINEANANGGGIVELPSGTYVIDDYITVYNNITLHLDDGAVVKRASNYASVKDEISGKTKLQPMVKNYRGAQSILNGKGYNYTTNITIEGGTWDGNVGKAGETSTKLGDIFQIYCANNITVKNTTLKGVCGFHHINFASVKDVKVEKVTFADFLYYQGTDYSTLETGKDNNNALNVSASLTSEALQFDNYEGNNISKNITVSQCTFKNVLSGVGNHHYTNEGLATQTGVDQIKIVDNTFDSIYNTCINLYNFTNATVSGNSASKVRSFVRIYGGTNNSIENNAPITNTNLKNKYNMFRISNKAKVTISGNTIEGVGNSAIKLDSNSNAVIRNNVFKGKIPEYGINVESATASVSGNTMTACTIEKIGVFFYNSTGTVDNNKISGAKIRGIGIQNASTVASVCGNVLTGGQQGIYLENGSGVTKIAGNQVNSVTSSGIYLSNKSTANTISNNEISSPKENGIYIKDSNVSTVSDNKISAAGTRGISLFDAVIKKVCSNTITSPKQDGIYLSGKSKVTYIGENAATKNVVVNSGANGICLKKGSTATNIIGNEVKNSASANIRVEKIKKSSNIVQNMLSGSKKQGISIKDSQVTLSGNKIKDTKTYGIYVEGKNSVCKINKNDVEKVNSEGIRINQGTVTIIQNQLKNIKGYAIKIAGGKVTVKNDNKFSKCSKENLKQAGGKIYISTKDSAKLMLNKKNLAVVGASSKSAKSVVVPAKVKVGNVSFKVNAIQKDAFKGNKKLKTIVIQMANLKKNNLGTNAFKGISSSCTIKVPKSKVKAYKKLIINAGAPSKVKIMK